MNGVPQLAQNIGTDILNSSTKKGDRSLRSPLNNLYSPTAVVRQYKQYLPLLTDTVPVVSWHGCLPPSLDSKG